MDTSRAETGSSQTISCGLRARARAMPMRWRCPPLKTRGGSGCRARGQAHLRPSGRRPVPRLPAVGQLVIAQGLADDVAAPSCGGSAGERVLEDDLHLLAPPASSPAAQLVNPDALRSVPRPRWARTDAGSAARGGLAAAALAHQPERLALPMCEADPVHGAHVPPVCAGKSPAA